MGSRDYRFRQPPSLPALLVVTSLLAAAFAIYVYVVPNNAIRASDRGCPAAAICLWHIWLLLAGTAVRPNAPGVIATTVPPGTPPWWVGNDSPSSWRGVQRLCWCLLGGVVELCPPVAPRTVFVVYAWSDCAAVWSIADWHGAGNFDELNRETEGAGITRCIDGACSTAAA